MRIGILTFHAEKNYGSNLQAFAMQEAYKALGHTPVIIDRIMTPNNSLLLGPLARKGVFGVMLNIFLSTFGIGTYSLYRRVKKTLAFQRKYLQKTPYSFYDWKDAPKDLGVDMISVGSDQIWNANLFPPIPYLLKDVDPRIPAISYAASFGMPQLPPTYLQDYVEGFKRFTAIGVRESQGVELVNSLGFEATQVVDPTLLVDPKLWEQFRSKKSYPRKRLFCYTLAEDLVEMLSTLEKFSKENDCDVIMLLDGYEKYYGIRSLSGIKQTLWLKKRLLESPVKIYLSASIEDFLREISAATWVVTNSYHALMFSTIFRKDVRIIVPSCPTRKGMHARMQEFDGTIIKGPLMMESLTSALDSCSKGEHVTYDEDLLREKIEASKVWLETQLKRICGD